MIARLQLQPAARELLLPLEQRDRLDRACRQNRAARAPRAAPRTSARRSSSTRRSPRASRPLTSRRADRAPRARRREIADERRLVAPCARPGDAKRLGERLAQPLARLAGRRQEVPLERAAAAAAPAPGPSRRNVVERREVGVQPVGTPARRRARRRGAPRDAVDVSTSDRSRRDERGRRLGAPSMPARAARRTRPRPAARRAAGRAGLERVAQHRQLHAREQQPHVARRRR